jgi:predicted O-methyltransferase YrrM
VHGVNIITESCPATEECPEPRRWRAFDGMSIELEVGELLAAFVRALKPNTIIETGTHRGIAATYMGRALRENGSGHLVTCEIDRALANEAIERIRNEGLEKQVFVECISSLELLIPTKIDMLFIDSEPSIRIDEFHRFKHALTRDSLLLFHDTATGLWREFRERVLKELRGEIEVVLLPTPRGLAVCQLKR